MLLKGKSAVITGASRGVGRAIATAFLAEGAIVHGTGRDPEALAETEAALSEIGGDFSLSTLELTNEAAICAFIDDLPSIDILVNNAGIVRITPFIETDLAELQQILATNLVAPFVLMRQTATKMLPAGGGQIIKIRLRRRVARHRPDGSLCRQQACAAQHVLCINISAAS